MTNRLNGCKDQINKMLMKIRNCERKHRKLITKHWKIIDNQNNYFKKLITIANFP